MEHAYRLTPEAFWARMDQVSQRVRDAAPTMPVFTVRAWSGPVMLGDWMWEGDRLVSAGLAHGVPEGDGPRVEVVTTTGDARAALMSLLTDARSVPGTSGEELLRRRREAATAPPTGGRVLDVDGADVRFDVWEEPDRWGAIGRTGPFGLVVVARGVALDDVALDRAEDLEPFIAGRDAHIRHLRGET